MMMIVFNSLAVLAYLLSVALIAYSNRQRLAGQQASSWLSNGLFLSWFLAVLFHGVALYMPLFMGQSLALDFISSLSHIAWFSSSLLLITVFKRAVSSLGLFLLPFAVLTIVLNIFSGHATAPTGTFENPALSVHIFVSLLAYSLLFLSSIQAILLAIQHQQLHNHHPGGLIRTLPALQDMEHLLFRLILLGVLLLSMALLSGFIFLEDLFAQHQAHKTVLSILAWIIYTILLVGHWKFGWRGRTAVRWTLIGFVFLMLAFLGSKFVLEFLIQAH